MDTSTDSHKLLELRAKTDRQLVAYLNSRLVEGLDSAQIAVDIDKAEQAYEEVRTLLPWVNDIAKAERRRFERKLAELRELLDSISSDAGLRVQAACS